MSFSVIIPSRNIDNLRACIGAIRAAGETARITVIDDSSDGRTDIKQFCWKNDLDWARGHHPFVFARNVNLGIALTEQVERWREPLGVILLNDDTLLRTPNGFSLLAEVSQHHPEYGVISPLTNVTGHMDQSVDRHPFHPDSDDVRSAKTVAFLCVLIPRRTIEAVGLLDERFVTYGGEDIDYCRRVQQAALQVGVFDGCYVDHGSLPSTFRPGNGSGDIAEGLRVLHEKWGDRNTSDGW